MGLAEGSTFLDQLLPAYHAGLAGRRPKPADEELIHRVRELYACIARGDFEALGASLAEDVEFELRAPSMPEFQGSCRGRAEVLAVVERNFSRVAAQEPRIREVVVRGLTVVVLARESGELGPEGRPYTVSWVQFFTFRGGLLCRIREIVSP